MERQAKDGTIYQQVGKDEWSPVTRAAKDGTVYKKIGADEWAPMASAQKSEPSLLDNFTGEKGKNFARNAIDTVLPIGGGIAAGLLATPESGGLATIPAGAAGYAGGKQLARIVNNKLFGDDIGATDLSGLAEQTRKDLTTGALYETGGRLIGEIPALAKMGVDSAKSAIAKRIGANLEYTPIANKEAVEAAAAKLGIKEVPKGVLTDNPNYQKLESGLSQSGSLPARSVKQQYNQFFDDLNKATGKISDLKSPDSDFAIGKSIQDDLTNQVVKSKAPVSELYNKVTPDLQKIPVNKDVANKVFSDLEKNPIFKTKDGIEFLKEHKDLVLNSPELNSLKELRSSYGDMIGPNSAPIEAKRIDALNKAVTSIRDNSIEAMKSKLPEEQVNNLINNLSLADSAHASNVGDINSVKSIVGNKEFKSPTNFINKISDMKEGDLAQRASNLDVSSLKNLQEKYPTVFDKAKTAKINDMIQRSTHPTNGFNDNSFLKQYDSLDKEMKDVLFSPEIQDHIEALRTVKQAVPDKLGPSGTPEGLLHMDMLNPKRNLLDYGIKKTLERSTKEAPLTSEVNLMSKPSTVTSLLQLLKGGSPEAQKALPRAADKEDNTVSAPLKGPDKWANDGANKLKEHGLKDQSLLDKAMQSPKGKDLLMQASDLAPGSKAMDKIFSQLKSQFGRGA